jgi:radical SAM protein with 4Fe4S-binding SPASM domain
MLPRLARMLMDYRRRSEAPRALPIRLWIETSGRCNLRCGMCPNSRLPSDQKSLMDMPLFRKIVDEAKTFANDVYLHHRGEPLLNSALFDMIAYAREAGLRTRLHTNGTLLDAFKAEKLLKARPDLVSFSVDGFHKQDYENIRQGANFETTVDNIIRFIGMRRQMRLTRPYVVVEKIRFRRPDRAENDEAINALWRRFFDTGVDEVVERDEFTWAEADAPEPGAPRTCAACTFPWYAMTICADGTVTPCPQDFHAEMRMGNAAEASLRDIWHGEAYRGLRRRFAVDLESLPLCRKCDRLCRRTVGGVPYPYLAAFLIDQLVGYNALRRMFGTAERK